MRAMGRRRAGLLLTLFLLVFVVSGSGQSTGKAKLSFKLASIHVKGLNRLKEDQVVLASGLQLGRIVGEPDFVQAVQKLGDTGLFTNVGYSYHYTPAGGDLELHVTEDTKLIPIQFDNFVWFSDDELLSLLRSRVPLFDGQLPLRGTLPEQVANALDAILVERKIPGRVEYTQSPALNGSVDAYICKVNFHPVVVGNIEFPGADPAEIPALQAAAKALSGHEYLRSTIRQHEGADFLPLYLARGYLKAVFSDPQAKIVEDGPRTIVDVTFPVAAGIQYRVAQVQWAGVSALSPKQLGSVIHLKTGAPANVVQLRNDLEVVRKFYGTKGYLMAEISTNPVLDDAAATVAYTITVAEGDVFHMGDLQIDGIDAATANKVSEQWQLKRGDVYDNTYLKRFFGVTYHDVGLSQSYSVVPKQAVNRQDKTVSVALHFVPKR